jgi:hypothetical protein
MACIPFDKPHRRHKALSSVEEWDKARIAAIEYLDKTEDEFAEMAHRVDEARQARRAP